MADEQTKLSEAAIKLGQTFDKAVTKAAKEAKKEVAGENKSENKKELDALCRSVSTKADKGEEAITAKKVKDLALKFYGTDKPSRTDAEKLFKALGSYILGEPKAEKVVKKQKATIPA